MPPGLDKVMTNCFRVLREDEDEDDEDEEMSYVRAVDSQVCASGMIGTTDKKSWASLGMGDIVVDSAAAFSTKPSKKKIILTTANGGEMSHYGEKEVTFQSGAQDDVIGLKFQ